MTDPRDTTPPIVRREVVSSTQAEAFALAGAGAVDGTVVVAEHQTAGRGRRGRVWSDAPGDSLLMSVIVRPRLPPSLWPALALMTAVAVADALTALTGIAARLKWPNDVLARGRKMAGILLESRLGPAPLVVVGVGVNLNQAAFASSLEGRATSVRLETGRPIERDLVMRAFLERFDQRWRELETLGFESVRKRWLELTETLGRRVTIDRVQGLAIGLDADGALLVDDGVRVHRITAGEIVESGGNDAAGG